MGLSWLTAKVGVWVAKLPTDGVVTVQEVLDFDLL